MASSWRDQTWEFGWDQAHAIGGRNPLWPDDLIVVLRSNPGGLWKIRWNPANQRSQLDFFAAAIPGMTIWEQLASWVGPD